MGTLKNKAEELRGRFKANAGKATGNRRWQAEGRIGQIKGSLKQAGAKITDAFKKWPLRGRALSGGPAPSWRSRLAYVQEARVTC